MGKNNAATVATDQLSLFNFSAPRELPGGRSLPRGVASPRLRPAPPMGARNPQEARRAAQEGMDRVEGNTAPEWNDLLDEAIIVAANRHGRFTTDDVWGVVDELTVGRVLPGAPNPSAIGPAMQRARRAGDVTPTDDFLTSERPSRHRNRLRVWVKNT